MDDFQASRKIAPIIKWVPLRPRQSEHDEWAEVSEAWYFLLRIQRGLSTPDWFIDNPKTRWERIYKRESSGKTRKREKQSSLAQINQYEAEKQKVLKQTILDLLPEQWDKNGNTERDLRICEIMEEAAHEKQKVGRNEPCPLAG